MASLKQNLKQLLINKQHKAYEKEVSGKKMSYSSWIEKQEEKVKVDNIIVLPFSKCLTNGSGKETNGGDEIKNEGFHSETDKSCRFMEAFDQKKGKKEKLTFFYIGQEALRKEKRQELMKQIEESETDVILFAPNEGGPAAIGIPLLYTAFKESENRVLIYGDEDVWNEGERKNPWFKPDWSPDTFLSCFYFGSITAVRTKAVKEILKEMSPKELREDVPFLYYLCEKLIRAYGGFSKREKASELSEGPVYHISEVLFHGRTEGYERIREWRLLEKQDIADEEKGKMRENMPLISIIIPSKDNPAVLFTCMYSLTEKTRSAYPYEILVVDNGSSQENKTRISGEIEKLNQKAAEEGGFREIRYYYEPMTFNFSRMCNFGANKAKGSLLLFLNDDMEIIQPDWLNLLAQKAVLPYAGAVGAKLLYPGSAVIQHAGITNLRVGPAHKLQFLSDDINHYYGKNRGVHDVLGVTGACLMLRREVFEKAGGFEKELAVAFNDVDLCYTIYENGYYNIVRNDAVLYHHESLSRGKDGESEEKQLRLLKEKDILYERHQDIYGKDPFYHKYLTTDMLESEYSPAFRYQVTLDMPWSKVGQEAALPFAVKEDKCVVIGMECAMDIYKWKYGVIPEKGKVSPMPEDMGYYFQGYSFVIGADNACYKKTLLLQNKESRQVLRIPVDDRYRADIRNNLEDQLNVDLTGFAAKVSMSSIPKGTYRFGMLAEDKCSRQKLVNWSSWVLQV